MLKGMKKGTVYKRREEGSGKLYDRNRRGWVLGVEYKRERSLS
jgi:hypothetical protein